jgi:hypothetical protein
VVGLTTAGVYALAFLGYAITRATATLLLTPDIDGGLAGTVAVTAVSLLVPVAVFTALCALPSMGLGALTALIIRSLLSRVTAAQGRERAALLGAAVCAAISFILLALLTSGLDISWTRGTDEALTFWLVLPLTLYTLAGALGSWWLQSVALWQSNSS